jgi:hypothetical protein
MDKLDVDIERAYSAYLERFRTQFGERPEGTFVKFGKHMIQKLTRDEFDERLHQYLEMHDATKTMLSSGATINDAVVLEYDEASAWISLKAPDMMTMFKGEIGDPNVATGLTKG